MENTLKIDKVDLYTTVNTVAFTVDKIFLMGLIIQFKEKLLEATNKLEKSFRLTSLTSKVEYLKNPTQKRQSSIEAFEKDVWKTYLITVSKILEQKNLDLHHITPYQDLKQVRESMLHGP